MSDSRGADPGDHSEAVGDADPVKATGWGLKSIKQIVPLLVPATVRPGEDFDDLSELYGRLIGQWATELAHVADVVGSADAQEKYAGQDGARYTPLPKARQKEAVRFLNENAFATPTYFLQPDILGRIEVEGALARINAAQRRVMNQLLNDRRLERLMEFEALGKPGTAYSMAEMAADLRAGVWSELASPNVRIDAYRRGLQRTYLELVEGKINPVAPTLPPGLPPQFAAQFRPGRTTSDIRSVFRAELRSLDGEAARAMSKATDRTTRAHLEDVRAWVKRVLEPGE